MPPFFDKRKMSMTFRSPSPVGPRADRRGDAEDLRHLDRRAGQHWDCCPRQQVVRVPVAAVELRCVEILQGEAHRRVQRVVALVGVLRAHALRGGDGRKTNRDRRKEELA